MPAAPQALVPVQYTRRVPTEVPTLEQAVREALPGTLILLARGRHVLSAPLLVSKQLRIKGEGSASECQLLCSGSCGVMVDRGGYVLLSAMTIHHVRTSRAGAAELAELAEAGMACAVRVSGAGSRLLLDHCEVPCACTGHRHAQATGHRPQACTGHRHATGTHATGTHATGTARRACYARCVRTVSAWRRRTTAASTCSSHACTKCQPV